MFIIFIEFIDFIQRPTIRGVTICRLLEKPNATNAPVQLRIFFNNWHYRQQILCLSINNCWSVSIFPPILHCQFFAWSHKLLPKIRCFAVSLLQLFIVAFPKPFKMQKSHFDLYLDGVNYIVNSFVHSVVT